MSYDSYESQTVQGYIPILGAAHIVYPVGTSEALNRGFSIKNTTSIASCTWMTVTYVHTLQCMQLP